MNKKRLKCLVKPVTIYLTICIQYTICILSGTVLPEFKENQNIF